MIRYFRNWLYRRKLIVRSERYRSGYMRARIDLDRGLDPFPYLCYDGDVFDTGARDAIFDWNNEL